MKPASCTDCWEGWGRVVGCWWIYVADIVAPCNTSADQLCQAMRVAASARANYSLSLTLTELFLIHQTSPLKLYFQ